MHLLLNVTYKIQQQNQHKIQCRVDRNRPSDSRTRWSIPIRVRIMSKQAIFFRIFGSGRHVNALRYGAGSLWQPTRMHLCKTHLQRTTRVTLCLLLRYSSIFEKVCSHTNYFLFVDDLSSNKAFSLSLLHFSRVSYTHHIMYR